MVARKKKPRQWIITYGETMPAWHKHCGTLAEVMAWVRRCLKLGDVIFSIREVR